MAGRLFELAGRLHRLGQDCGKTYGHRLLSFRIDHLSPTEFRQRQVPLHVPQSNWNSARYHHMDVQRVGCPAQEQTLLASLMQGDGAFRIFVKTAGRSGIMVRCDGWRPSNETCCSDHEWQHAILTYLLPDSLGRLALHLFKYT